MVEAPTLDPLQRLLAEGAAALARHLSTKLRELCDLQAVLAFVTLKVIVIDRQHERFLALEMIPQMIQECLETREGLALGSVRLTIIAGSAEILLEAGSTAEQRIHQRDEPAVVGIQCGDAHAPVVSPHQRGLRRTLEHARRLALSRCDRCLEPIRPSRANGRQAAGVMQMPIHHELLDCGRWIGGVAEGRRAGGAPSDGSGWPS